MHPHFDCAAPELLAQGLARAREMGRGRLNSSRLWSHTKAGALAIPRSKQLVSSDLTVHAEHHLEPVLTKQYAQGSLCIHGTGKVRGHHLCPISESATGCYKMRLN